MQTVIYVFMTRVNSESDAISAIAGNTEMSNDALMARLPEEFHRRAGETATAYRDRVAPAVMEHLMARVIVKGDDKALDAFVRLHTVDCQAQVRVEELLGKGGGRARSVAGSPAAVRTIMGLPAGHPVESVAAGAVRASDLGRRA